MKRYLTIGLSAALICIMVALSVAKGTSAQQMHMKDILPLPAEVYDAAGNTIATESLRGKIVALYFSAHWCAPCREFTPKLVDFRDKYQNKKFEVVFMSLDTSAEEKANYMKEERMKFPSAPGQGSVEINQIMDFYQLPGVPSVLVFGPEGELITLDARNDILQSPETALAKWRAALK